MGGLEQVLVTNWPIHTGDEGEYLLYLIAIEAGSTSTCTVNGRLNPENLTVVGLDLYMDCTAFVYTILQIYF